MSVDAKLVGQLRSETGAGIIDCKKALVESGGDIEKAKEWLREQGVTKANKKQDRDAGEGIVISYIHSNNKVGVLLTLQCETDFVARNEAFKELGLDICMHIAALNPVCVDPQDIPSDEKAKQEAVFLAELGDKPEEIKQKIVEGKMQKYFEEVCLLAQPFIKDEDITIGELIAQKTAVLGEKIEVGKFARFEIAGSTTC